MRLLARAMLEEEFEGKTDTDEEDEADNDDDEESAGVGEDEDVYDEDNDYTEILARKQRELDDASTVAGLPTSKDNPKQGDEDDDEDEEDDKYEDEEGVFGPEQLFDTPLDKLDSYILFSQAVHGLQQHHHDILQMATQALDQQQQQSLEKIMMKAQKGGEAM